MFLFPLFWFKYIYSSASSAIVMMQGISDLKASLVKLKLEPWILLSIMFFVVQGVPVCDMCNDCTSFFYIAYRLMRTWLQQFVKKQQQWIFPHQRFYDLLWHWFKVMTLIVNILWEYKFLLTSLVWSHKVNTASIGMYISCKVLM